MDLLQSLARSALSHPRHLALDVEGRQITYGELDVASRRVAGALAVDEVGFDDRVAYLGRSSLEFYLLALGAMRGGAVVVPLNWRCTLYELLPIVSDIRPKMLVVDVEYYGLIPDLLKAAGDDVRLVTIPAAIGDAQRPEYSVTDWSRWIAVDPVSSDGPIAASDTVLQIYTSGTTGKPKGVMSSHTSLNAYLQVMAAAAGLTEQSVSLSALPHFHIGGVCWTLSGLLAGASVIVARDSRPSSLLRTMRERDVSNLIAVPTLIQRLAEENEKSPDKCDSIQTLYYGGSSISAKVYHQAVVQFDCDLVQGYGLTECSLISILDRADHRNPALLGSCGKPLAEGRVRLVDPSTGTEVEQGNVGEIWVQSPLQMKGYWSGPAHIPQTTEGEWFRTGDMASQDRNGFLFLHDRLKDVIVSGGENVFSAEVEAVIMLHPGVSDCAVIGVPSQKWNETVLAVVVPTEPALTEVEVIQFCRKRLAHYKCPTSVVWLSRIPRNHSGKVVKGPLREQFSSHPVA